jgi:hypothetical protein
MAVWALAIYTVVLGALAAMGSPVFAGVFYTALLVQVVVHTVWICPRCINMYCAVNPNSPHYILGPKDKPPPPNAKPMNQNIGVLLLGLTFVIGLTGVWLFSPLVWMFMAVTGGLLLFAYSRTTCRMCANKCFMNRSAEFSA